MSDKPLEPFYLKRGEEIVTTLYDKGYLDQSVTRDDLSDLDEFLGYMIQIQCESAARAAVLNKRAAPTIKKIVKGIEN